MTYIKKLGMKGFKSFARETPIYFDRHVVCIVGPNGSGKSNVLDALCFVLGRLSIKSIRASKASHLIFSGNKHYKPANQAYVEIVFDNSDKTFALDNDEIAIRRIVKKNGQGVYKINGQVKTRQEVLELLGQAGIDPYGFNIVLQGEIEKFVKMPAEERRKVIEEVSGISIYEMRKEKSMKELDKTNEKLKQINSVLRERANYIRNLEKEREQALRYKKLQGSIKRYKASIIQRNILDREKELKEILKNMEGKNSDVNKKDEIIIKFRRDIGNLNKSVEDISKEVQQKSGFEQDSLLNEISEIKQDIAGLGARKENYENNLVELDRRKERLNVDIKNLNEEIDRMSKEKGRNVKRELEVKKNKLDELEETKRQYYLIRSNLSSVNNQISDKMRQIAKLNNESDFILNSIENLEDEIKIRDGLEEHEKKIENLNKKLKVSEKKIEEMEESLMVKERECAINGRLIEDSEKIKSQISELDVCPLCKTKVTKEHIKDVIRKVDGDISGAREVIENNEKEIKKMNFEIEKLKEFIEKGNEEVKIREICIVKIRNIREKKDSLRRNNEEMKAIKSELKVLEDKKRMYENKVSSIKISEEMYENLKLEVSELQRSEEKNLGIEIATKQREVDRARLAIKQIVRDREELVEELKDINESLEEKESVVEEKEEQAEILKKKYQKMFEEKNKLQDRVRSIESDLMKVQNEKRLLENDINNLKISCAQINAKIDSLKEEIEEFGKFEFLNLNIDKLKEKLRNAEVILERIGSVNMKALEVYEGVKEEYDKIRAKVEQLDKEKEEILKVIEQIDRKKRRTFMRTLKGVNELFSRNFSQLSDKGVVNLEVQDKKEIFNAGLDIVIKVGAGKYFDITSLSGGEQTLVALSLIFAIQEHRPYSFYVFDEIDAALDKRNSQRLAYLLKKHMKEGQYLIITHNDSIISESSNVLYGVSMQEGISKVLSLEV